MYWDLPRVRISKCSTEEARVLSMGLGKLNISWRRGRQYSWCLSRL